MRIIAHTTVMPTISNIGMRDTYPTELPNIAHRLLIGHKYTQEPETPLQAYIATWLANPQSGTTTRMRNFVPSLNVRPTDVRNYSVLDNVHTECHHVGSGTVSNMTDYLSEMSLRGAGTIGDARNFHAQLALTSGASGTVATATAIYVRSPVDESAGAASLTNFRGIYMEDITLATSQNYAVYTNAGRAHFGDTVEAASLTMLANAYADFNNATASQGLRIPTSPPPSPQAGSMYFDTATATLYMHDGTAWRTASFT